MTGRALLLMFALASGGPQAAIGDLDGAVHHPFAPRAQPSVLLFLSTDCPISNRYVPEIQQLCGTYILRGVNCLLLYEDARVTAEQARDHRRAYRLAGLPAAIDATRAIAHAAGATMTPEAVVLDREGAIRYRGRIDDVNVSLMRRRAAARSHDLRDAIDDVLAGRPVARPRTEALGCYISPPRAAAKEP